jgi:hypothetical protein
MDISNCFWEARMKLISKPHKGKKKKKKERNKKEMNESYKPTSEKKIIHRDEVHYIPEVD